MRKEEFFKNLKNQNLTHLEKRAGLSRQALHNALKSKNMKLDNLSRVAKALDLELEFMPLLSEENLMGSLVRFGVPLAHSSGGNLSLEEALVEGLKWARCDGLYETLTPYMMALNVEALNVLAVAGKALQEEQVNVLGYFAELAQAFRPHTKWDQLLRLLTPAKSPKVEFLVLSTKTSFPELFAKNKLALRWNLKVRGTVEDHLQRWRKWEKSQKLD